ncbi:MAG TPA: plastocyanin/azurin family copper-binding protein [Gemmatimonadaceae bacterium]|nr:plastocyanin/azurin family copper-binding protein [Gemmatimonadaceae bacterium]
MKMQRIGLLSGVVLVGIIAACSGGEKKASDESVPSGAATSSSPAAGGKVIVVKLITDGTSNRFEPNEIEAHKGDVIRYTLAVGVHNVHFLPDSNPGKTGLPPASDMLQLPGQTYDLPVTFAPGKYYFQCDPHALLGMQGHLKVED